MPARILRLMLILCGAIVLISPVAGCHSDEHKKTSVKHEQRESDYQEEPPGEMVVE